MLYSPQKLQRLAEEYCQQHDLEMKKSLGRGLQGMVFSTTRESAINVHAQEAAYVRERNVYLRLSKHGVLQVRDLTLPELLGFDDSRLIIEMSLVRPPFIVDFGGAYLDAPAEHTMDPGAYDHWREDKAEQFGANWPLVQEVLSELESSYGIFVADVNPGNIQLGKIQGPPES